MLKSYFLLSVFFLVVLLTGCKSRDTESPEVIITYPPNNIYIEDTLAIKAEAIDNIKIKRVEFYIDGDLFSTDTTAPYSSIRSANSNSSAHTIFAKAYDNEDNYGLSDVVTVYLLDTTDTESPMIAITTPASGAVVTGTVEVKTETSDNKDVSKVVFYVDGDSMSTSTTKPFTYLWDTMPLPNNSYTILAKAYDPSNNWANSMVTVRVLH
ncbi:MAG: Ig-like domain-containing protein [bacterium]|nr:Ig-like domain-containing protein [bacterium]